MGGDDDSLTTSSSCFTFHLDLSYIFTEDNSEAKVIENLAAVITPERNSCDVIDLGCEKSIISIHSDPSIEIM